MFGIQGKSIIAIVVALAAMAIPAQAGATRFVGLTDYESFGSPQPQRIVSFSSENVSALLTDNAITGLGSNEVVLGMARDPNGTFWLLTDLGPAGEQLRTVSLSGAVSSATPVVAAPSDPYDVDDIVDSPGIGVAFDSAGKLRVITSNEGNYTIDVSTGEVTTGTSINPDLDPSALAISAGGAAYAWEWQEDVFSSVDLTTGLLVPLGVSPPGSGYIFETAESVGLEITPDNKAYVTGKSPSPSPFSHQSVLYQISLSTPEQTFMVNPFPLSVMDIAYLSEEPSPSFKDPSPVVVASIVTSGALGTDSKGKATATLSCPTGAPTCNASYRLDTTKAVAAAKKKAKKLKLGSGKTTIAPGQSKKVTIKLSSKGRKLLKKKKKLTVTLTIKSATITKKSGTLKQPKKK